MGNTLAERIESEKRGHGRGRGLVRADWRPKHRSSSLAVCGPRGEEGKKRAELGSGGVGRDRAQDCATDPEDAKSGSDSNAMESGGLRRRSSEWTDWGWNGTHIRVSVPRVESTEYERDRFSRVGRCKMFQERKLSIAFYMF